MTGTSTDPAHVRIGPPRGRSGHVTGVEAERLADTFGRLLRTERAEADLTVAELARHAGVEDSTIARLEAGERRPRADLVYLLALVLRRPRPLHVDRRGRGYGVDLRPAQELARQFREAAGDSLVSGGRRGRVDRIRLLERRGETPEEAKERMAAAAERTVAKAVRYQRLAELNRAIRAGSMTDMRAALDELEDLGL